MKHLTTLAIISLSLLVGVIHTKPPNILFILADGTTQPYPIKLDHIDNSHQILDTAISTHTPTAVPTAASTLQTSTISPHNPCDSPTFTLVILYAPPYTTNHSLLTHLFKVCAPSRCALMTGRHTGHARIRGNQEGAYLHREDITFPMLLQSAGYHTGAVGKWGLGACVVILIDLAWGVMGKMRR